LLRLTEPRSAGKRAGLKDAPTRPPHPPAFAIDKRGVGITFNGALSLDLRVFKF